MPTLKSTIRKTNNNVIHHSLRSASACNTDTTQTQPHQISNTQRNKNKTTNVVIQQQSQTPDDGYINVRNMLST